MSDQSLNIKDRHAWPVAGSVLLLFLTAIHAVAGLVISALGFTAALIYYYRAKKKQHRQENHQKNN